MAFSDYDTDKNGSISEAEFNAAHDKRMQNNSAAGMPMKGAANRPMFSQLDINNDAKLSADELKNGQMHHQQDMMGMHKQQQMNMQDMRKKSMQQQFTGGRHITSPALTPIQIQAMLHSVQT